MQLYGLMIKCLAMMFIKLVNNRKGMPIAINPKTITFPSI